MREKVKKKSVIRRCLWLAVLAGVLAVAGIPVQGMGALTAEAVSTTINSTNFPDATFRAYVTENFDTDGNGVLSDTEKNAVTEMGVSSRSISSLEGVGYFKNLQTLRCYCNQLSGLDVSQNTALTVLDCVDNQLSNLDVRRNTALVDLDCSYNQLSSLDVSQNTALTVLDCSVNQLSNLDVRRNTALMDLDCSHNHLGGLDVSQNTALTDLDCACNQLSNLDVSQNTALTVLDCPNNQLSSLDVSRNTVLTDLDCDINQLSSLDVSKNTVLENLHCYNNQLSSLDVRKNTALKLLNCDDNQLSCLDVSRNAALEGLYCVNNQLSSLDVSQNTALSTLCCFSNRFSNGMSSFNTAGLNGFDLSRASGWTNASISGTVVTAVDVSSPVTYTYDCGNNHSETFTFIPPLTVTLNANGGSCSTASKSVTYGSTYDMLPTPTRTGYSFSGWYTSASEGSQVTDNTIVNITSDQTLYAHWTEITYTVTFNANGGNCSTTNKSVAYGNSYGTLPTPTRTGYSFSGWYTSTSGGNQVTSSTIMIASDQTLYAHWTKNEEPQTTGGGQQVQKPSNPGAAEKRDIKLKTPAKQNNKKRIEKLNISLESATGVTKADQYMVLGKTKVSKKKLVLKLKTSGVKIQTYKSSNKKVATVSKKGVVKLKKIGSTTITVTAIVTATGKKISKKYSLTVNPDKTVLESVESKATGKITIKWKQNPSGDGYEVYWSMSRNFKEDVKSYKIPDSKETVSTIKGLIPGAKYYIKVRSYKLVSGKPYFGAWSKGKAVKVK